jgi:hypothetical protein
MLDELYAASAANDTASTLALLRQVLPEYQPSYHVPTAATSGAPYPDGF